ncbi:MAG TPA: flagellin [Clostridium sp.]|nr:flagellin [Clostridium sp.]
MRLNKNMFSLNIYKNYKKNVTSASENLNNISSGLKLEMAKNNPGKIAQSESLKIQTISNSAAERNVQNTVSMLQTADSAMQEINNNLIRARELSVQACNGALSEDDKKSIQDEINQINENINYISNNTQFNGVKLLNGTGYVNTMTGSFSGEETRIEKTDLTITALGIKGLNVETIKDASNSLGLIDIAIESVSTARSKYGALQSALETAGDNMNEINISLKRSQSKIADANIAEEMVNLSKSQIIIQSAAALMSQSNQLPQDALQVLANIK